MTPITMTGNFAGLLWGAADRWPDRVAIESAGAPTTYRDLQRRASLVRTRLDRQGIVPGDRVVVFMPRSVDAAAALFGALATGAIVCVVNEESRPHQLAHACATVGARVLLVDMRALGPEHRAALSDVTIVDAIDPVEPDARTDDAPAGRRDADPALITFTSGSTGQPKGVVASHANLWSGVTVVRDYLGLRMDDRIAGMLSFAFVYGFNQLTTALSVGATLVLESVALPPMLLIALRDRGVTVMAAVPPLWQQLLRPSSLREAPWPSLRVITNAGGALAPHLVRQLRAAQPQARLFLMYGLTEGFRSTFLPPEEVDAHPESMGRAVPGSRVVVLRDDGTECGVDEIGEVVHSGPTVALGYWDDPEATARTFRPDPLAHDAASAERVVFTGDLARRDAEGRLYHCGRRDEVIKTLGFRISPDEVSAVLQASGAVAECAVHGVPDAVRGQAIVAHVVLAEGATLDALRIAVGTGLPKHMHPARFIEHAALPRTPNGKIDLRALREHVPRA